MPMLARKMEVEKIEWASSTLKTRELPKTVYRGLILHLEMTVTNSTATITADTIAGAISKLDIVINGQDTIMSLPGWMLFFMNKKDFSIAPPSTIADTNGAGRVNKVTMYLPFAYSRAVSPSDGLLDLRGVSSVTLQITWSSATGTAIEMGTGCTITSGEMQIDTDEFMNVPADANFSRHELSFISESPTATGMRNINLDYGGNNQYQRLFIFTRDSSDVFSDSEISKVGVRSRSFFYMNQDIERLYNQVVSFYSIAHDTGVYVIDFTRDGRLTQRLDARGLNELVLEATVATADGTIYVLKDKAIYL